VQYVVDEPTSGLDSHTAFSIIQLLKDMAANNTVVLLTIHQPSSEIFFLLDSAVYMVEGRIFYQGPVTQVVPHFSALGYECPMNYNPCDFVMSLCQTESSVELEKKGLFMDAPPKGETSPVAEPNGDTRRRGDGGSIDLTAEIGKGTDSLIVSTAPFFVQLSWLVQREVVGLGRNKGALMGRFGVTIFLNFLFGLIFFNAGKRDNADNDAFNTHVGAITMVTISSMFGAAQPTMLEFPFDRPMFMREYVTGTCKFAVLSCGVSIIYFTAN